MAVAAAVSEALRARAAAMLERVTLETAAALTDADPRGAEAGTAAVRSALHAALHRRDRLIDDDHDPRCLLPARTVRILIADAGVRHADTLAAAAFIDSIDATLVADAAVLGEPAARILGHVPLPLERSLHAVDAADGPELLERLVCAPPDASTIAVAERLDQARHLHMRPELPWVAFHAGMRDVYIPVAHRVAPVIARRMDRWAEAFGRRLLRPD